MLLRQTAFLMVGLASLTGCFNHNTGHVCVDQTETFALDQKTHNGVSGLEFSKGVIGSHSVQMSPAGDATSPTPGTLTVEVPPGAVFSHIASDYIPCKPGKACTDDVKTCLDKFSLPVRARLVATDGSIDETWEGILSGLDPQDPDFQKMHPGNPAATSVGLSVTRPADSFKGAFKIPAPRVPGNSKLVKHEVTLGVEFQDGKVSGGQILNKTEAHTEGPDGAGRVLGQMPFVKITPAP